MARKCDISNRKTTYGNRKKHQRGASGGGGQWRFKAPKTRRTWRPNLRKIRVAIDGKAQTLKVSMKAYKKLRKLAETNSNIELK